MSRTVNLTRLQRTLRTAAVTDRALRAGLFLGLVLLYVLTADYGPHSIDTAATAGPAWHLAINGTPWVEGLRPQIPWYVPGAHGHTVSNRFPGTVLLAVPFYWLLGGPATDQVPIFPGAVCAGVVTAGAMTVLFSVLLHRHDRRLALGGTLVLAVATPTWSVSAAALWTHGPAQFAFALALLACARGRSPGPWLGLAVLVRPHLVVVGAVFALHQAARRDIRGAVRTAAGVLAGVVAYLVWNRMLYGRWTVEGGYDLGSITPHGLLRGLPGLPLALVSPQRGLLLLSPFLLLLVPGLVAAWRTSPWWYRSAAAGGVLAFVVTIYLVPATGGDSFYGYRLPLESLLLTTPLLLGSFEVLLATSVARLRAFTALVALSAALIASGAVLYAPTPDPGDPWTTLDAVRLVQAHGILPVAVLTVLAAGSTYLFIVLGRHRTAVPL